MRATKSDSVMIEENKNWKCLLFCTQMKDKIVNLILQNLNACKQNISIDFLMLNFILENI